jgi:hypothetical protein
MTAALFFYPCSVLPSAAWKNGTQQMIKYHAAAGKAARHTGDRVSHVNEEILID